MTPAASAPSPLPATPSPLPAKPSDTATAPAASAPATTLSAQEAALVMDDPTLEQTMLDAINQDRREHDLQPVAWDETAALAGARHVADMAQHGFFSHWNRSGYGPEYRYTQAGGSASVMENIYSYGYQYTDGRPAPIDDFVPIVERAEEELMLSPGHRRNILTPEHTHVGVGFAYNAETGMFLLAQEFTNHYVELEGLPMQAQPGAVVTVAGTLRETASEPLLNLAYQPFPSPRTVAELNTTSTYRSDATIFQALDISPAPDGSFQMEAVLDNEGQPGLYSMRVWVEHAGDRVLANDWTIAVR
jgi:uncharacterized protein YkwD